MALANPIDKLWTHMNTAMLRGGQCLKPNAIYQSFETQAHTCTHIHMHCHNSLKHTHIYRVGQNRISAPYMPYIW